MAWKISGGRAARILACLVFFVFVATTACSPPGPKTREQRTVDLKEFGYKYVAPPGWRLIGEELISDAHSLLTVKSFDLFNAKKEFVADLPQSIVPQLEGWTKYFFILDGEPVSQETTLGGLPALQLVHPIRIRPTDPPSKVVYWVTTRGELLYILRITFPPGKFDQEWPAAQDLIASFEFTGKPKKTPPFPGEDSQLGL